jgi:hypothetical protein
MGTTSAASVPTSERANELAAERLCSADPWLIGVAPAIDVVPGMDASTILASGVAMPWERYEGGQRDAIIGGALFEGLAGETLVAEE